MVPGALGTVAGAVGGVPIVPLPVVALPVVLPMPVLPVPARSCRKQSSRLAPIMFSQRLRPPIAEGDVTGDGVELTEGVCEGVTAGVCEGVTDGVWDGVTAGAGCWDVMGG